MTGVHAAHASAAVSGNKYWILMIGSFELGAWLPTRGVDAPDLVGGHLRLVLRHRAPRERHGEVRVCLCTREHHRGLISIAVGDELLRTLAPLLRQLEVQRGPWDLRGADLLRCTHRCRRRLQA